MNGHPQRFARIECCVPFCTRGTTAFESGRFICGKCWRSAPLALRRRYARIKRYIKRAGEWDYAADAPGSMRAWSALNRSFERIRAAITTQAAP